MTPPPRTRFTLFVFIWALHPSTFAVAQSGVSQPEAAAPQIQWRHDYNTARQEAHASGRPLLVDIGTEQCFWCQKLDTTTFRDPALVAILNEQLVPLKVDGHREPRLVEALRIQGYPTLVLADPNGKIFETLEGYVEAPRLRELVQRLLTTAESPAWMTREYQEAATALEARDYARAVERLRKIVVDGKELPLQNKARTQLREIEEQADARLGLLQQLADAGQELAALDALHDLTRVFAGTQAATDGNALRKTLAASPTVKARQRERQARELILQAREDFQAKRFLLCLDRCDLLLTRYPDLLESAEAKELAAAIQDHPDRLRSVCDGLAERLAAMQLLFAESLLKQGKPTEAASALEQVIQKLPGTRHAEQARGRLDALQRLFPRETADAERPAEQR